MRVRNLLLLFALVALVGCGPGESVRVGEADAEPGVVKRDIDLAKNVAATANARDQGE